MRVKVTMRCSECKQRNYNTMKNKKNDPDRLVVSGMLSAESAVLLHFETVGVILLVLHGIVVSLLALRASQSDFNAHNGTSLKLPPCITPSSKI